MGVTVTGLDEVIKMLEQLSDQSRVEEIAKKAVNAAAPAAAAAMRSAISASEAHRQGNGRRHREDRSTGSIAASITTKPAKINQFGVFSVALPTGYDAHGVANAKKAAMLENGTPQYGARPWRSAAASSAEGPCVKIMESIVKAEMKCD